MTSDNKNKALFNLLHIGTASKLALLFKAHQQTEERRVVRAAFICIIPTSSYPAEIRCSILRLY